MSAEKAAEGSRSLCVWNEAEYDDGVTCVSHPVPASGSHRVTGTAEFWSESQSFNILRDAVMRLGPERPETEAAFPEPGGNTSTLGATQSGGLREPLWLAEGWREYTFEWTTPEPSPDTLLLALGLGVISEGDATHYVDDIGVEFIDR